MREPEPPIPSRSFAPSRFVNQWAHLLTREAVMAGVSHRTLTIILTALLIVYAMFRSRRPQEPAQPQRFSFGRMLLVAVFLAGLAFLVK
jgi:heme A synthase